MNIKDSLELVHYRMAQIEVQNNPPTTMSLSLIVDSINVLEECIRTIAEQTQCIKADRHAMQPRRIG